MVVDLRRSWVALLAAAVLATGCAPSAPEAAPSLDAGFRGTELTAPFEVTEVTLTDTQSESYTVTSSAGRPVQVLFFGYTHCPDVCPGVLADLASAMNRVTDDTRTQVEVIFVTTDPARDTPGVIREYLDRFDPQFTGLTGDLSSIVSLADSVGVAIEKQTPLPSGGYDVDHTASVIGIDRQGRGSVVWTVGTPIGDFAHDFERLVSLT